MATKFDAQSIRNSGNALGSIMDDMTVFSELKEHWPNAGQFELAQWIERVVDDRRNGMVAHAEQLKIILDKLSAGLISIADDLEEADDNSAVDMSRFQDLKSEIIDLVSKHAENTESEQHNFTQGNEDPALNQSDGDGYDDVIGGGQKESGESSGGDEESSGDERERNYGPDGIPESKEDFDILDETLETKIEEWSEEPPGKYLQEKIDEWLGEGGGDGLDLTDDELEHKIENYVANHSRFGT